MTATVFLENNPDLSQPVTDRAQRRLQASTTHLRANDKVTTDDLLHLLLIASGQRRGPRAGARVRRTVRKASSARMNEKASELGLETHALRRSVRPALRQRVVGLRHGASHHACVGRTSASRRSCALSEYTGLRDGSGRSRSAARTTCSAGGDVDVRAGKTGFISKAGYCLATVLRLPQSRSAASRSSCSARARTPAASWNRATCSTGRRRRRRRCSRAKPISPAAAAVTIRDLRIRNAEHAERILSAIFAISAVSSMQLSRVYPAAWPPRRAAASRSISTATITGRCASSGVVPCR